MQRAWMFALAFSVVAGPALAEDEGGVLNPSELTIDAVIDSAQRGETSMMICAQGYALTKSGRHVDARTVFLRCADAGYTGAMTWMSQLDGNGLGAEEDIVAAAEWDRRAALAGDPVGQFNYGLDLLRGHGVPRDIEAGQAYVRKAAEAGLKAAQTLEAADFDVDEVTPDADEWKYQQLW